MAAASGGRRRLPVPHRVQRRVDAALDSALDRALRIQRPAVIAYVHRVRTRNAAATPAELVRVLERRYLAAATSIGGASGAAAAVPGAGTGAALATGAAEVTGFVAATALYVLALAELHGVPVSDPELRRALVVAVLLGDTALEIGEQAGSHWAEVLARRGTRSAAKGAGDTSHLADARWRRMLLTRFGARQGALLLGRALPLGIGAGIGAAGNAALARAAIATARTLFGPPPDRFPPRVIDISPRTTDSGVS
jgi:hypothetical protein